MRLASWAGDGLALRLGLAQLVFWGASYYLIAVFGEAMARSFHWTPTVVYGGFSGALVVMGLTSGAVGRAIDRYGGRRVMSVGAVLMAVSCAGLGLSQGIVSYLLGWTGLGLAMRMTLYEAAFAAVVRVGGPSVRARISQITLLGGLASTVFWPFGYALEEALGWRAALFVYAGVVLLTLPLCGAIPDARRANLPVADRSASPLRNQADSRLAATLYAASVTLAAFISSGMSAHMIGLIAAFAAGPALAVWLSALRGIGQSGARLCEVLFLRRLGPLALGVLATGLLPICFLVALTFGTVSGGAAFALLFGAGNGLLTIVRGTQPLVLFDHRIYGGMTGWLTAPGFFAQAIAPLAYAGVIETGGSGTALGLSLLLATVMLLCACVLWWRFRRLDFAPNRED